MLVSTNNPCGALPLVSAPLQQPGQDTWHIRKEDGDLPGEGGERGQGEVHGDVDRVHECMEEDDERELQEQVCCKESLQAPFVHSPGIDNIGLQLQKGGAGGMYTTCHASCVGM